jgi:outer membrane protein OmpA-like peptidoglycan-associated protein
MPIRALARLLGALSLLALAACAGHLQTPHDYAVYFQTDSAELDAAAQKVVEQIADDARAANPSRIVVFGRADGGTAHDATLADQRGAVVMRALVDHGVPAARVEQQPDAPDPTRTGVAAHQVIVTLLP